MVKWSRNGAISKMEEPRVSLSGRRYCYTCQVRLSLCPAGYTLIIRNVKNSKFPIKHFCTMNCLQIHVNMARGDKIQKSLERDDYEF